MYTEVEYAWKTYSWYSSNIKYIFPSTQESTRSCSIATVVELLNISSLVYITGCLLFRDEQRLPDTPRLIPIL